MKQLLIKATIAVVAVAFAVIAYVMAPSEVRIGRVWDVRAQPLFVSSSSAAVRFFADGRRAAPASLRASNLRG